MSGFCSWSKRLQLICSTDMDARRDTNVTVTQDTLKLLSMYSSYMPVVKQIINQIKEKKQGFKTTICVFVDVFITLFTKMFYNTDILIYEQSFITDSHTNMTSLIFERVQCYICHSQYVASVHRGSRECPRISQARFRVPLVSKIKTRKNKNTPYACWPRVRQVSEL